MNPPVPPMLATLARSLPVGDDWWYEPKWDGLRCLIFRDRDEIDLRSRNRNPFARYFPELVDAVALLPTQRIVLDGEIVVARPTGFDFAALLERLHPAASRVERLRTQAPASFIAFDVLAVDGDDLRAQPFEARRRVLEKALADVAPPLFVTPATTDPQRCARWLTDRLDGVEGVMAKHAQLRYEAGRREMVKVKQELTADCVVAGFRWHRAEQRVGSLLLGLYDDAQVLRHVGVTANFNRQRREQLTNDVRPAITTIEEHPWRHGFNLAASSVGRLGGAASRWQPGEPLSWVPLEPRLVAEVAYDSLQDDRFRHPPRFRRWRPDRNPQSCTYEQFPRATAFDLAEMT